MRPALPPHPPPSSLGGDLKTEANHRNTSQKRITETAQAELGYSRWSWEGDGLAAVTQRVMSHHTVAGLPNGLLATISTSRAYILEYRAGLSVARLYPTD